MTLDRLEVLGLTLFAIGGLILLVSIGVRTYRTNQYSAAVNQFSAAVDRYSREVDEALVLSDAAVARGDFAEARRILQGPKRPEVPR